MFRLCAVHSCTSSHARNAHVDPTQQAVKKLQAKSSFKLQARRRSAPGPSVSIQLKEIIGRPSSFPAAAEYIHASARKPACSPRVRRLRDGVRTGKRGKSSSHCAVKVAHAGPAACSAGKGPLACTHTTHEKVGSEKLGEEDAGAPVSMLKRQRSAAVGMMGCRAGAVGVSREGWGSGHRCKIQG